MPGHWGGEALRFDADVLEADLLYVESVIRKCTLIPAAHSTSGYTEERPFASNGFRILVDPKPPRYALDVWTY